MDWLCRNDCVASSPRAADNLGTNLVEVTELFIRDMKEFAPFVFIHSCVGIGD